MEIYRQTSEIFDLSTAAVLTLIQFVAVGAILAVHAWTVRRRETALRLVDASVTARRPRGAGQWALLAGVLATVAVLLVLPLAVLVQRSLDAPDFGYYRALTSERRRDLPRRRRSRRSATRCSTPSPPPPSPC